MVSSIFISYRRDDTQGWAGRLSDSLRKRLKQTKVYRDIEDIPPGKDFRLHIRERISFYCDRPRC